MAARTTTYLDSPEVIAFRAVENVLRNDPGLLAGGTSFRSWNGDRMDGIPIVPGHCPLLRLSPEITQPDSPFTLGRNASHLSIKMEFFVAGLMLEDLVNFWATARKAMAHLNLFEQTTVECYLQSKGISRSIVTMPGFGAWQGSKVPSDMLSGVGRIDLLILVPA